MSKPESIKEKKALVFFGREAWVEHVSEYQKRGLSQPEYAEQHRLNTATFRNWVIKLKREEQQANEIETTAFVPGRVNQPSLKEDNPVSDTKEHGLHIRLPNGIECTFPANHAPALILPWIEYLRVLP